MPAKKSSKKSKSSAKSSGFLQKNKKIIVVILIFTVVASALLVPVFAKKGGNGANNAKGGKTSAPVSGVYLKSSSNKVSNGSSVTFGIWANSLDQNVNAVLAQVTYPVDKFEFVSIDSANSAFSITAQETASAGLIKIARGARPPIAGDNFIANITLKALASNGSAKLSLDGSSLLSSDTNTDVATEKNGVSIRFSR